MICTRETLQGGLRLLTVHAPESPALTVLVLVGAGSAYEDKRLSGVSHFLEHMCFKGTAKRPRAIDISRELDGIGAQYNAFTGHEFTGYYAKVDRRHRALALDVVADIFQNSALPAAEIEKEKGVIIEEIRMYRDMPHYRVHDAYLELLHGDQPAGWNIAGTPETVSSFGRDDVAGYRAARYTAGATVVIVAGAFDEATIAGEVASAFCDVKTGEQGGRAAVRESQTKPAVRLEERQSDQAHLVLGVRTFDIYDARNPALRVLASVLGGGMSSRLFEKLRNELGICYYVSGDLDGYTDHGSFDVSAGVDVARAPAAVAAIMEELRQMRDIPVPAAELAKAKEYLTGSLYLSLETSNSLAHFYGAQEVLQKPLQDPDATAREIAAVTAEDVRAVAADIMRDERLNLAVVGPFADSPPFEGNVSFR